MVVRLLLLNPRPYCPAGPARMPYGWEGRSGYEQAQAKLRGIESDKVAVAFGPPA